MKCAILFVVSIQFIITYSETTTPQPGGDDKRTPKFATSNKSVFDLPASNDTRLVPGELNNGISTGNTDFSRADIDDIVRQHNQYRANTKPSAADMKHMFWDGKLATMSQDWADKCIYEHGGFEPNLSPHVSVGQNLYVGFGAGRDSGVLATDLWHDEEQFYWYDSNSCEPGEVCGHYTQVIWADSSHVGCGRKLCPQVLVNGQQWRDANIIVCNYGPAGNYRGVLPFTQGDRCKSCPDDAAFCTPEGLCRDCVDQTNEIEQCGECIRQCQNCGTLDENTCTCQCAPGWDGPDCSEPCANHHEWCGVSPGWPTAEYCDIEPYGTYAREKCREMCGSCQPSSPDFQCNRPEPVPATDAPAAEPIPATDAPAVIKNTKYCKTTFSSVAVINQQLYAFKKEKFWRFDSIRNGLLLSSNSGDDTPTHFQKVNPDVRAVYQRGTDDKVTFFRGKNYWQYYEDAANDQWLREDGFPRSVTANFPGLPKSITAAVYDRFTSKTYFIKGAYLWRYDETKQTFDMEKERIDNVFEELPSKMSGAFQDANGDLIFVKGRDYWRVPYGENRVSSTKPQNLALAYMDCYE